MESFLNNIALLPAAISAFVINGFVTAYTATKLGDPTSRIKGKLTLSPRVHIDLLGMLLFVTTNFGWTKPLEVNPRYFKNQKRDSIITVLSGSLANFVLALFASILAKILTVLPLSGFWQPLYSIVLSIASFNVWLGLFCLLPIPPLNGFLILEKLLPTKYFRILEFLQQYGFILVFFLSIIGVTRAIIYPFYNAIAHIINFITNLFFH